jgi:UPF0176 protein
MSENDTFLVLAFYHFTTIPDPHHLIDQHKLFFKERQITSRIYISESGINGQMSGLKADAEEYMIWLHQNPLFKDMPFKIHLYHENVFPRQIVKYRKQLVAIDEEIDLDLAGEHASPEEWRSLLEGEERPMLIDVRNEYEWKVGRFEGAECPPCETFRQFKGYAENLKTQVDPTKTPIMMYCTGGIRCELYSALLKKYGFEKVYQLSGGIINYGLKEGSEHWLGKLFVFDDRMTVPIADEPNATIGTCHHCGTTNDSYYNCANMDCNNLFLCCPNCLDQYKGCCCAECQSGSRMRPYHYEDAHKPFKKKHHYQQNQQN